MNYFEKDMIEKGEDTQEALEVLTHPLDLEGAMEDDPHNKTKRTK